MQISWQLILAALNMHLGIFKRNHGSNKIYVKKFGFFVKWHINLRRLWGAHSKFPDFCFRMGAFIDSKHMKLKSPSK